MLFSPGELHPGGQEIVQYRGSRLLSVHRIVHVRGGEARKLNGHGFES